MGSERLTAKQRAIDLVKTLLDNPKEVPHLVCIEVATGTILAAEQAAAAEAVQARDRKWCESLLLIPIVYRETVLRYVNADVPDEVKQQAAIRARGPAVDIRQEEREFCAMTWRDAILKYFTPEQLGIIEDSLDPQQPRDPWQIVREIVQAMANKHGRVDLWAELIVAIEARRKAINQPAITPAN